MSTASFKTKVSSFLAQYIDLPASERYQIDDRIDQFQADCESMDTPPQFATYVQGLSPEAGRVLQRELMHEYSHIQHLKLDESLRKNFASTWVKS